MRELQGQIISGYRLERLIGEGGMSYVYLGLKEPGSQKCAVKLMKEGVTSLRPEDLIRFRREAGIMAKLTHPNLLKVYETGEYVHQGKVFQYMAMEYAPGQDLDAYWKGKPDISVENKLEIIFQIVQALDYVHNVGLVHRDLKPGNVMIVNGEDGRVTAKLLDFGLSQLMELTEIKDKEEIVGTFSYMSPEQSGIVRKPIDNRSDLYSLGVVFYEIMIGRKPFNGETVGEILHQHAAMTARIPQNIPEILGEMILKLLKKDPEERYQTAKGFIADLEKFKSGQASFVLGQDDKIKKLSYHTRLIGREEEFERLKELYESAREGKGGVCLIAGEAGRGKSRLVEELRNYVYETSGEFIGGKCFDQANKIPYQPFSEAINEYLSRLNRLPETDRETRIARMKAGVGELAGVISRLNSGMGSLWGETPELVKLDLEQENRRFLMVCSRFFLGLGETGKPVVIMLDDLQWSDEGTINILMEILETISGYPLLILGTYRDNEVGENHSLTRVMMISREKNYPLSAVALENFDINRINRMLCELLMEKEERVRELGTFILQKSKGNPFFTIEIVRQLVDGQAIENVDGGWQISREKLAKVEVSKTILDIIIKRIEILSREQMELYSTAAVIGRKFKLELLYGLSDLPKDKIIGLVDEGIGLQLLERGNESGDLLFVHDRIKDAFYHKLGEEKKKELHGKVAITLETAYQDNKEEVVFDLAHHYSQAGDKEKILEYALPAAQKAKQGYANEEAIRYFEMGLGLLEEKGMRSGKEWMLAKEMLAEVYIIAGRSDDAIKALEELLLLKNGNLEKAKLYNRIGEAWQKKGNWRECEKNIAYGLALLGEKLPTTTGEVVLGIIREFPLRMVYILIPVGFFVKDTLHDEENKEIVVYFQTLGWMYVLSDIKKFAYVAFRMLNIAKKRLSVSCELGMAHLIYAAFLFGCGFFKIGKGHLDFAVKIEKSVGNKLWLAYAIQLQAGAFIYEGSFAKGIELENQAREMLENMGDLYKLAMTMHLLGDGYFDISDYEKAIYAYNQYFEISKKINDDYGMAASLEHISSSYIEIGDFIKAEEVLQRALKISDETKNLFITCAANAHYSYLEIERGDFEAAVQHGLLAKKLYEKNIFLQKYTVFLYVYLAEAYIRQYPYLGEPEKKKQIKNIRWELFKAKLVANIWPSHRGALNRVIGQYYALVNKNRKAEKYFLRSIDYMTKIGRRFEEAKSRYEYSLFLQKRKNLEESKQQLQKAYDIFKAIGSKLYEKRCADLLGIKAEIAVTQTAAQRLQEEQGLEALMVTARNLSSILDLGVLLEKIIDESLKVTGAERGALLLYSEKDKIKLEPAVTRNLDEGTLRSESFRFSQTIINKTAETKQPQLVLDALSDTDLKTQDSIVAEGLRSVLCAPLMAREELLGLVYLDNKLSSGIFSEQKKEVLQTLAAQAAVSIENARLYAQVQDKVRMEEELRLGRHIQANLIPKIVPKIEGLVLAGLMEPAKEIGGDYYDFIVMKSYVQRSEFNVQSEENRNVQSKENKYVERSALNPEQPAKLAIAIGDVSGKGVGAGMLMASAKATLRSLCGQGFGPAQILKRANRLMYQYTHGEQMMTMLLMEWDPQTRQLSYSSCGHEHILISRANGSMEVIRSGGLLMGIVEDVSQYTLENKLNLGAGDTILLYTDGSTEARDPSGNMFTLDRLKESFNRHRSFDPDALVTAIKTDINSFMSGADQYDDITLVALRFNVATNTQDMMTESIGEIIKLEMFADMEVVPATRAMIMDIAARKKYVQSRIQELNTIIDELLTNAIRHGSSSCKSRINLECSFFDNRVEIAVSDEGNKLFDYQAILNEHREIVEREQKEGKVSDEMVGRGLLLIEHFSDRVNVDKSGSGTRISVLKNMGE